MCIFRTIKASSGEIQTRIESEHLKFLVESIGLPTLLRTGVLTQSTGQSSTPSFSVLKTLSSKWWKSQQPGFLYIFFYVIFFSTIAMQIGALSVGLVSVTRWRGLTQRSLVRCGGSLKAVGPHIGVRCNQLLYYTLVYPKCSDSVSEPRESLICYRLVYFS